MNNSFEVGVQYCVPTTGKTLDPLAKVPEEVLDKVQRHTDRFFHAASPELVLTCRFQLHYFTFKLRGFAY